MPLTSTAVSQAKPKAKQFKLSDSHGLYLQVMPNGSKYWRYKYRFAGKEKVLALGVFPAVSLKDARSARDEARLTLEKGVDPGAVRKVEKLTRHIAAAESFEAIGREWFEKTNAKWSAGHADRTKRLLEKNLYPYIGSRPIKDIEAPEVLAVVRRIEARGSNYMAHRAKQVAGLVFQYAIATGRAERNPTLGLTNAMVPRRQKHHAAITDPAEVGKLMVAIDAFQGTPVVNAALQLSALLFQRPGEIRGMEWSEIKWDQSRWEIPAEKMKMGMPHVVPLSRQALAILEELHLLTGRGRYVFPSARGASRSMSENTVRTALRTMGYDNDTMTAHGFRAMARTILDEVLGCRVDWIEHQLAHQVKDSNGRAYNRTAHVEGRAQMMQQWADYLDQLRKEAKSENVVNIRKA